MYECTLKSVLPLNAYNQLHIINAYADADASSAECTTNAVSLNPGAKDYIYNVIGSDAQKGSADVFIEELYDAMLEDLILKGKVDQIDA